MIAIDLFLSLDGVGQAPGGPEEDPSGGFPFGGWQAPFDDDVVGRTVVERILAVDALLVGRRTYDIFASYWPEHTDNPIGAHFARIPKYVASRSAQQLGWQGASQLGPDLVAALTPIKESGDRVHVIGSLDLAQTLLADGLWDELALWCYPLVLGGGKRLFPEGAAPTTLSPLAPPLVGSSGAVLLRYGPGGPVTTGTIEA